MDLHQRSNDCSIDMKLKDFVEQRYNLSIEGRKLTCNVCGFSWSQKLRRDRNMSCPNCHPSEHGSSKGECELYDLLNTTGLRIIHNDRTTLDGKELDIYFPDLNFAIEYDGSYWHSKEEDLIKEQLCLDKNIKLIRINDTDWKKNGVEILNSVLNLLCELSNQNLQIDYSKIKEITRSSGKCRKIICTDTGEIFDNYIEACKKFDCSCPSAITNVCIGKINNYKGYHFEYYNGKNKTTTKGQAYHCKHIKCLETGEVFESKSFLKKHGVSSIDDCIYGNQKTACGMHWKITTEEPTDNNRTMELINNYLNKGVITCSKSKRVVCINTGVVFSSITEAATSNNLGKNSVANCCNGKIKQTKNGLRFCYENIEDRKEYVSKVKTKPIRCVETEEVFNSVKECAEKFGADNPDLIARAARGQNGRKTYKGFHFEYLN